MNVRGAPATAGYTRRDTVGEQQHTRKVVMLNADGPAATLVFCLGAP